MDSSRQALKPDERGLGDAPAKSQGKLALALGVIAITLNLVLGFVYLTSVRRLEREVARLSQQTEGFNRLIERAQEQSQDVSSAGFASGCERADDRPTARLGEAGSNRTRRRRRNLRGSRPPPSSKRRIDTSTAGWREIPPESERRNLHNCNRL